jgi:hypothetical protein
MWLPMTRWVHCVGVTAVWLTLGLGQQEPSGTPGNAQVAVHRYVHDPRIVDNGAPLPPIPPGIPHSEWTVNGSKYVVAYRNEGKGDPFDIVADIYYEGGHGSGLRKLISVPVFMQVEDVKLVSITGDSSSQLAFFRSSGQQDWLTIVVLDGPSAHKLFDYGARWIKLTEDKPPKILAHSHPDDTTETFEWCASKRKIVLESACSAK